MGQDVYTILCSSMDLCLVVYNTIQTNGTFSCYLLHLSYLCFCLVNYCRCPYVHSIRVPVSWSYLRSLSHVEGKGTYTIVINPDKETFEVLGP